MEILLVIAIILIGVDHIMLRRKYRSQALALKGLRGYCQDFTKAHREAANVFGEQFHLKQENTDERCNGLYGKLLGIEDQLANTLFLKDKVNTIEKRLPPLKKVSKKKVAKKKVSKKKVTKKKS